MVEADEQTTKGKAQDTRVGIWEGGGVRALIGDYYVILRATGRGSSVGATDSRDLTVVRRARPPSCRGQHGQRGQHDQPARTCSKA